MFFIISGIMMIIFLLITLVGAFFMFDEIILKGYVATKMRKRWNVEDLK